jgi:hypothetical protein
VILEMVGGYVAGLLDKIQWHPGFYGAAELELLYNKDELEFDREYNLTKESLRVDLLIVKKCKNVEIKNEIGRIFKQFNILEYKSPDDGMSIDDYFKTVGYACIYKGFGNGVNAVPAEELTVSLFRETYPREMFDALKRLGATIEEKFPGIYYVKGLVFFDTQIVVTGQLSKNFHSSLRVLSKNVQEEDVKRFLLETENLVEPGDIHNVDAVLQVSVSANQAIYEKVKEDVLMCEAMQRLMKDEINEKVAKGRLAGRLAGREEGRREGIINAIALCKDFGADKSETSNKIAKQFSLSIESATRLVEENW